MNHKTFYHGPLGLREYEGGLSLTVWAPAALELTLLLDPPYGVSGAVLPGLAGVTGKPERRLFAPCGEGAFTLELEPEVYGCSYLLELLLPGGETRLAVDPYAQAVHVNGEAGVLLLAARELQAAALTEALARRPRAPHVLKTAIVEVQLRDASMDPSSGLTPPGGYLALAESAVRTEGKDVSGLAYWRALGATHLQFMPLMDFASIDETQEPCYDGPYNWGYDPAHYFVPEGSYASDSADPRCRMLELARLVAACHAAGLRVILDVVLNHVYQLGCSALGQVAPEHYFRYRSDGSLADGTGCGNETASEHPMMRRLMRDVLRFWAETYGVDGFRFDLMGIHDVGTLQLIRADLEALRPSQDENHPEIFLLGEGWTMGQHTPEAPPADQAHAADLPGIAFFNDGFRECVRGAQGDPAGHGFILGRGDADSPWHLFNHLSGARYERPYLSAAQNILYAEIHDNLTLWDHLALAAPQESAEQRRQRQHLALSLQLLGQGVPILHAGVEFLRSKGGAENSYNLPDHVNALRWSEARREAAGVRLVRDLLWLRRFLPLYDSPAHAELAERHKGLDFRPDFLAFEDRLPSGESFIFAFNAACEVKRFELPPGRYLKLWYGGALAKLLAAWRDREEACEGGESWSDFRSWFLKHEERQGRTSESALPNDELAEEGIFVPSCSALILYQLPE